MRRRQWIGKRHGFDESLKFFVEGIHAREVAQDAIRDAEGTAGQSISACDLQQIPVTKRTGRRDCTPVSVRKRGQCKTERGIAAPWIAVRRSTNGGEAGIQLRAGTHQQESALEVGKSKGEGQRLERGRW